MPISMLASGDQPNPLARTRAEPRRTHSRSRGADRQCSLDLKVPSTPPSRKRGAVLRLPEAAPTPVGQNFPYNTGDNGLFLHGYEYRTCDLFFLQNVYFLEGT